MRTHSQALGDIGAEACDIATNDLTYVMYTTPTPRKYSNHATCMQYKQRITAEFEYYDKSGIHEWHDDYPHLSEQEFALVVNQGLVVTRFPDDGKGRFCLNFTGSGLTELIIVRPFSLSSPAQILEHTKESYLIARSDMSKARQELRTS